MKQMINLQEHEPQQSLPARERGLKRHLRGTHGSKTNVAPRAGAWIETLKFDTGKYYDQSLPARERGLKQEQITEKKRMNLVAPRAGAWIETFQICCVRIID